MKKNANNVWCVSRSRTSGNFKNWIKEPISAEKAFLLCCGLQCSILRIMDDEGDVQTEAEEVIDLRNILLHVQQRAQQQQAAGRSFALFLFSSNAPTTSRPKGHGKQKSQLWITLFEINKFTCKYRKHAKDIYLSERTHQQQQQLLTIALWNLKTKAGTYFNRESFHYAYECAEDSWYFVFMEITLWTMDTTTIVYYCVDNGRGGESTGVYCLRQKTVEAIYR